MGCHNIPVRMANSRTLTIPDAESDTEHNFHLLLEAMKNNITQHNRILSRNKTKGLEAMKRTGVLNVC